MPSTDLPTVIDAYQSAYDRHDTEAAVATFGVDGSVIDDGAAYVGAEQIRSWLTKAVSEYTYARTLTSTEDLGDGVHVVHNHLPRDFPGGQVDLRYRFQLRDGLIHRLDIAP